MDPQANSINWFEIGVTDFERARKFYETIFGFDMYVMDFGGMKMGMFPAEPGSGKANGAICKSEHHAVGIGGALLYLNGNPDLAVALSKVEAAGGKIMRGKTQISPEYGYMAMIIDTEGNAVALHSNA